MYNVVFNISRLAKASTFTKLIFINTKLLTWNINYKVYLIPVFKSKLNWVNLPKEFFLKSHQSFILLRNQLVRFNVQTKLRNQFSSFHLKSIKAKLDKNLKSCNTFLEAGIGIIIQKKMCLKVSEKSQQNTCTRFSF